MSRQKHGESWIPLQTYFARAVNYGVSDVAAAEALLSALRNPESGVAVRALERIFEDRRSNTPPEVDRQIYRAEHELHDLSDILNLRSDDATDDARIKAEHRFAELKAFVQSFQGDREHVPRRIDPVTIPFAFWADFDAVDDSCTSWWRDDDEGPANWSDVDWLSGSGQMVESWGSFRRTYSVMQVDRESAFKIVDQLARGAPNKSAAEDIARVAFIKAHSGAGEVRNAIYKQWQDHALFDGTDRDTFENDWYRLRNIPRRRGRKRQNP